MRSIVTAQTCGFMPKWCLNALIWELKHNPALPVTVAPILWNFDAIVNIVFKRTHVAMISPNIEHLEVTFNNAQHRARSSAFQTLEILMCSSCLTPHGVMEDKITIYLTARLVSNQAVAFFWCFQSMVMKNFLSNLNLFVGSIAGAFFFF